MTISSWLNFGRRKPREGGGLRRVENYWPRRTTASAQCLRVKMTWHVSVWVLFLDEHWHCTDHFVTRLVEWSTNEILSDGDISRTLVLLKLVWTTRFHRRLRRAVFGYLHRHRVVLRHRIPYHRTNTSLHLAIEHLIVVRHAYVVLVTDLISKCWWDLSKSAFKITFIRHKFWKPWTFFKKGGSTQGYLFHNLNKNVLWRIRPFIGRRSVRD